MVHAAAGYYVAEQNGVRSGRAPLFNIPADHWEQVGDSDTFWLDGDLTYNVYGGASGGIAMTTVRLLDVRFEPQGVHAIVGSSTTTTIGHAQASYRSTGGYPGRAAEAQWWDGGWRGRASAMAVKWGCGLATARHSAGRLGGS